MAYSTKVLKKKLKKELLEILISKDMALDRIEAEGIKELIEAQKTIRDLENKRRILLVKNEELQKNIEVMKIGITRLHTSFDAIIEVNHYENHFPEDEVKNLEGVKEYRELMYLKDIVVNIIGKSF